MFTVTLVDLKNCFCFTGSVELASAGVSISVFNIISKLFNVPLLSVATSFVAEDIAKNATKVYMSGRCCIILLSFLALKLLRHLTDLELMVLLRAL